MKNKESEGYFVKVSLKRLLLLLLVMLSITFLTDGNVKAASDIPAPILSEWKDVTAKYAGSGGDGQAWQVTWKKVNGAEGYQVKYFEKETPDGEWYTFKTITKKCRAEIQFSSLSRFKVKVRAYKTEKNGKKVYGEWAVSNIKKIVY